MCFQCLYPSPCCQLFSPAMDTEPLCTLNDSKSKLPVLEETSNRARWASHHTNTECKLSFSFNYRQLNIKYQGDLNESYVCFRRRECKSVQKTRASQVTSSDKLARLQIELHYPLEIAKAILSRASVKKEVAQQGRAVWEKQLAFADLKRKFPMLNDKLDEELLVDKRPVKKNPMPGKLSLV
jgi:hypothetical protein